MQNSVLPSLKLSEMAEGLGEGRREGEKGRGEGKERGVSLERRMGREGRRERGDGGREGVI